MSYSLADIAEFGTVYRPGTFDLTMFPASDQPLSLCYVGHRKVLRKVNQNDHITAVITDSSLAAGIGEGKGVLVADNPAAAYYAVHNWLYDRLSPLVEGPDIHETASIAPSARIAQRVVIGEGAIIDEGAMIFDDTVIGPRAYVGPGAIVGTRGMQNLRVDGKNVTLGFMGGVLIGSDCQLLAYSIVQKPYHRFFTHLEDDSILSIKSSVGHGCKIGKRTMIAGSCTLAGNVIVGEDSWIGPGCTIRDELRIGSQSKVVMGSVVGQSVPDGATVAGLMALDHEKAFKFHAKLKR